MHDTLFFLPIIEISSIVTQNTTYDLKRGIFFHVDNFLITFLIPNRQNFLKSFEINCFHTVAIIINSQ